MSKRFGSAFPTDSPCETAGLEQLRVRGILEPPGVSDESSQCLLFILIAVVVVLLPQVEVVDALLLAGNEDKIIIHRLIVQLVHRRGVGVMISQLFIRLVASCEN